MIGKIIAGRSFGGTVGYVMKRDATILDAEGITLPEVADVVRDFHDQTLLNPRVKNDGTTVPTIISVAGTWTYAGN